MWVWSQIFTFIFVCGVHACPKNINKKSNISLHDIDVFLLIWIYVYTYMFLCSSTGIINKSAGVFHWVAPTCKQQFFCTCCGFSFQGSVASGCVSWLRRLTPRLLGSPLWMAACRACCLSASLVMLMSGRTCTLRSLETCTAMACEQGEGGASKCKCFVTILGGYFVGWFLLCLATFIPYIFYTLGPFVFESLQKIQLLFKVIYSLLYWNVVKEKIILNLVKLFKIIQMLIKTVDLWPQISSVQIILSELFNFCKIDRNCIVSFITKKNPFISEPMYPNLYLKVKCVIIGDFAEETTTSSDYSSDCSIFHSPSPS